MNWFFPIIIIISKLSLSFCHKRSPHDIFQNEIWLRVILTRRIEVLVTQMNLYLKALSLSLVEVWVLHSYFVLNFIYWRTKMRFDYLLLSFTKLYTHACKVIFCALSESFLASYNFAIAFTGTLNINGEVCL